MIPSRTWPALLVVHAVVALGLTAVIVVLLATTPEEGGANIGAGILALPLLPLGLPWSLPFAVDPYRFDPLGTVAWHVVAFGPAVLNVAIHTVVFTVVRARRRRARPLAGGTAPRAQGR